MGLFGALGCTKAVTVPAHIILFDDDGATSAVVEQCALPGELPLCPPELESTDLETVASTKSALEGTTVTATGKLVAVYRAGEDSAAGAPSDIYLGSAGLEITAFESNSWKDRGLRVGEYTCAGDRQAQCCPFELGSLVVTTATMSEGVLTDASFCLPAQ